MIVPITRCSPTSWVTIASRTPIWLSRSGSSAAQLKDPTLQAGGDPPGGADPEHREQRREAMAAAAPDHRQGERKDPAGADALNRPEDHELDHVLRRPAERRAGDEDRDRLGLALEAFDGLVEGMAEDQRHAGHHQHDEHHRDRESRQALVAPEVLERRFGGKEMAS